MKQRKLNVTYRDLERKDYPYIEKIIRDTWNYDSICDCLLYTSDAADE